MNENPHDDSVNLFFDSFAKHLRRIRDDGKDPAQGYRAQILLGQLQQFQKSIEEGRSESIPQSTQITSSALFHIADLEALVHWLTAEQKIMQVVSVFYLDRLGVWQRLYGETGFPKKLKVLEWLERGSLGLVDLEGSSCYVVYAHGQPRLVLALREDEPGQQGLMRFVARLLPLFVTAEIVEVSPTISAGAGMIAADAAFLEVLTLIKRVSAKDVTVLLEGESGTGKEVVASFIHKNSARADKPYVAVNCAAIPAGLIESELFGHEKGAFTSAHQRKIGRLEEAQGGTLFLDEIGEVELAMQAKLLRFIQLREFHRVGGRQKLSVNIRIVAATNRDLKARVAAGHFREDLYYRLSVAPFRVPPLRDRVDDILPLARFFLRKYAEEFKMALPEIEGGVFQLMTAYPFPGNVRELENLIQNILVLSQGERITPSHLPLELQKAEPRGKVVCGSNGQPRIWRARSSTGTRFQLKGLSRSQEPQSQESMNLPWLERLPMDNEQLKNAKLEIQEFARKETHALERRFLDALLARADGSMPQASHLSGINRTLLYKMLERTRE